MPTPLEAEISSLLRESKTPQLIADDLLHRWRHRMLSEEEQADCAQFLINSGLYTLFFQHVCLLINERALLPWAYIAESIDYLDLKPTRIEVEAVIAGAKEQNALEELAKSRALDSLTSELKKIRSEIQEQQQQELEQRLQALKEKLQFMRNNRLFDQEAEIIRELQSIFPDRQEAADEMKSFEYRWAREIIAKSISNSLSNTAPFSASSAGGLHNQSSGSRGDLLWDLKWNSNWKFNQLTPEQITAKEMIVISAHEHVQKNPNSGYDLALSLQAMDFHIEALDILNESIAKGASTKASDWLKLELMLSARRFVDALEESHRLEVHYASDPETSFAAVYARARALRGLGQTPLAVDLLRSLVRIRPNYKSAQSLLLDWSGGES